MAKRKLTVEAVVFDDARRVLLVRDGRPGRGWELPGGKLKPNESMTDGVAREVFEETGVRVTPEQLIGIFFIAQENTHNFVVICRPTDANPRPVPNPPEIIDCGFFDVRVLPDPIRVFTMRRIADAREGVIYPLPVELTSDRWLG